jgi:hypothetical protein
MICLAMKVFDSSLRPILSHTWGGHESPQSLGFLWLVLEIGSFHQPN